MERLLKSRYKIGDKIGESPFSVTYMGSYIDRAGHLVVKIYKRSVLSSSIIKTVKRKVRDLVSLKHPNIAAIVDGDYGWQGFYFVREYVSGKPLTTFLFEEKRLPLERAMSIFAQIAEAVSAAHDRGIIHGALSTNNIFILPGDLVKVADFTILGEMRSAVKERSQAAMGFSDFLSPEEVRGEGATARTDVYSLGLMLYMLLSGKNPFRGSNGLETSLKILRLGYPSLKEQGVDVPEYVDAIIAKAMEPDPLMRFESVFGLISSVNAKTVVDEGGGTSPDQQIGLDGVIDSAGPVEIVREVKAEGKKKRPLMFYLVALAVLLGAAYALFNFFLPKTGQ